MKVTFRKFPDGDVIALFPEEVSDANGAFILSYQRIGQHGDASPELLSDLEVAEVSEYIKLYEELELIGYNLEMWEQVDITVSAARGES